MYQEPQFACELLVMMFLTAIAFIRPDSPIVAALTTIVIPVAMVARSDDVRFVASWVLFLAHWCYIVGCFFFAALIFLLFGIVAVLVPLLVWQEVKSLQFKAKARFAAYVLRRNANPGRRRHARRQLQAPRDAIEKELRLIKLLDSSCANLWEAVEAEKPRVLKAFDFAPPEADWYPAAELLRTCLPCGPRIPIAPRTLEEHDRTKNYESDERLPDALTCFNHQIDIEVCRLELEVEDLNGIYEHNDRIKEALWSEKEKSLKTFKWFVKFLGERGMIFTNTPRKDYDGSDLLPSSLVFEPLNFQKKQPQGPLTLKRPKVQWSELPQPKFTELVGSLFPNESPAQPLAQEAPATPSQEERGPDTAHTSGSEQGTKESDPCGFPFGPCHHIPEHLKLDLTPVHESEESGPDTAHTSTDQNAEALTPDHEESGPDTAHTSGPLSNGEDPILSDDGDDDWVTTDDEDEEPILSDDGDEDWVTTDSDDDDDDDDDDDEDDNDADAGIPSGPASSPLPPLPPSSPFPPTPVPAVFTAPTVAASPSPSAEPALPPSPRLIPLPPSPPLPPLPALPALPPSPRLGPLAPSAPSSTGPVSQAAAADAPEPVAPAQSTSFNPFLSATPSLPVWFPAPTAPPAAPVSAPTFNPFVPVSSSFPPVPSSLFPPTPLQLVPSSSIPPNPQVAAPVVISEQQMDTDSDEEEGIEFEDVPIGQGNGTSEDEGFQMDQDTQVDDEGNMDIDSRPAKDEDTMSDGDEEAMLVNSENSAPSATDDVHEQGQAHDGNNDQGDNDPVDSSAAADSDSDVSEADIAEMNAASFGDDWVPGQSTSAPGPTNNAAQGTEDDSMGEVGAPTPPVAPGSSSAQPTPQRSPFAASSSSSQSAQPAQRAQPSYLAAPQASSLGFTASGTPPPPASSAVSQTSPVMYFGPVRAQPSSFVAAPQPPVSYGFTASTSAARFSPFAAPQAPAFGFTATAPSVRPSPFAAPQSSSFGFTATAPVTRPSPFAAPQASSPGFTASTSPPRPSASAAPQSGFTATAPTTRPSSSAAPRASSSSASANAVATSSTAPSAATAGPSTSSSFTFAGSFSTAANTFDSASIFGSAMSQVAARFDWAPRPRPGSGNNPFVQAPAFGTALAPLAVLMEPMRSAVRVAVESWRQQGATMVADELEANWETMFRKVAQSKANGNADKKLATTMEEAKAVVRHFVYRVGQMRSLQKAPEQVVEEFRDNLWSAIIAQDFLPDPDDEEEEEEAKFAPMPEEANDEDSESEVSEEE
ncbi:uncharacterized protein E0L32_003303 [Thyridium curvatum]|uniref:Uncharacterized protein n=1 Tax=Thyridium curvatum TaxID=1093900 RepID=A0A507B239_9PEZI|nr:uncharacterized protein E0L32_003303 [Thyridium curvatum]TPX17185.1 hypothetical protein E0L32_003303 [Thyridium curvatum]